HIYNDLITEFSEQLNEKDRTAESKLNKKMFITLSSLSCSKDALVKELIDSEAENIKKGLYIQEYSSLWKGFLKEIRDLPDDSVSGFTESLLFLLKRYTWCIPASTNDMTGVSLFEHLKTTASIAQCLYDFQEQKENHETIQWDKPGDKPRIANDKFPFLLVCWDLSGIQKFIYDISGRKAAVSLKGRSFYLQLLVESIIQKTLLNCKTNWGNVIYSSGGKLFMLLPNLPDRINGLRDIKQEIEEFLWNEHQGRLSVCLGMTPFSLQLGRNTVKSEQILIPGKQPCAISDLWRSALESASTDKFRKFKNVIVKNDESSIFTPSGRWGENYSICVVSGVAGQKGKELVKIDDHEPDDEATYVTSVVKKQKEIGESLKKADYILTYLKEDEDGSKFLERRSTCIPFPGTGINHYLFNKAQLTLNDADFRKISSADVARVRRINETDFSLVSELKGRKCSYGFLFYGGNKQASFVVKNEYGKDEIRNKTFEELCWIDQEQAMKPEKERKKTFLGVLRMDVDSLGRIFIKGIPDEQKSFAAYSTLSFMLDLFFSGMLNKIREPYADFVNIIYSGGDDVFAVGRWDKIIDFAESIRESFRQFTGREDVSISAGIVIVGEKFPIRIAAKDAGEAEDASKEYLHQGNVDLDKNAITLFGQTISWQHEWDEVKKLKNDLKQLIEGGELSKAIIHQLIKWKTILDENKKGKNDLSYRWNTAYYLKRYRGRIKEEHTKAMKFLRDLEKSLFTGEGSNPQPNIKYTSERYYDLAALAARWAEMELKEFKSSNSLNNEQ
ncbi:MAG: type III-A CRISPR-associated protein Cas10/Csm1, partial [Bacteroidetes bacterium]|nr:type III-A CRISPR-associated protein Cas10/Csm1 [Bacteroidota bacterium]